MALQTEYTFILPRGYIDESGTVHQQGTMRLATALDEITPLRDPRVRNNEAYLVVILLAQVITSLGSITNITPEVIEEMFAADIAYLQDFYRRINDVESPVLVTTCPNCQHRFEVEVPLLGES